MLRNVFNLFFLSILNTFAVQGIMWFYMWTVYWSKKGVVMFDPSVMLAGLLAFLYIMNLLFFFINDIYTYNWSLRKKIISSILFSFAPLIVLILLMNITSIFVSMLQNTANFIEWSAR